MGPHLPQGSQQQQQNRRVKIPVSEETTQMQNQNFRPMQPPKDSDSQYMNEAEYQEGVEESSESQSEVNQLQAEKERLKQMVISALNTSRQTVAKQQAARQQINLSQQQKSDDVTNPPQILGSEQLRADQQAQKARNHNQQYANQQQSANYFYRAQLNKERTSTSNSHSSAPFGAQHVPTTFSIDLNNYKSPQEMVNGLQWAQNLLNSQSQQSDQQYISQQSTTSGYSQQQRQEQTAINQHVLRDLLQKSGVIIINNSQQQEAQIQAGAQSPAFETISDLQCDGQKVLSQLDLSQNNQQQLLMLQQLVEDALQQQRYRDGKKDNNLVVEFSGQTDQVEHSDQLNENDHDSRANEESEEEQMYCDEEVPADEDECEEEQEETSQAHQYQFVGSHNADEFLEEDEYIEEETEITMDVESFNQLAKQMFPFAANIQQHLAAQQPVHRGSQAQRQQRTRIQSNIVRGNNFRKLDKKSQSNPHNTTRITKSSNSGAIDLKFASEAIQQALVGGQNGLPSNIQIDFTATAASPQELAALSQQFAQMSRDYAGKVVVEEEDYDEEIIEVDQYQNECDEEVYYGAEDDCDGEGLDEEGMEEEIDEDNMDEHDEDDQYDDIETIDRQEELSAESENSEDEDEYVDDGYGSEGYSEDDGCAVCPQNNFQRHSCTEHEAKNSRLKRGNQQRRKNGGKNATSAQTSTRQSSSYSNLIYTSLALPARLSPNFKQLYSEFSKHVDFILRYEYRLLPQQKLSPGTDQRQYQEIQAQLQLTYQGLLQKCREMCRRFTGPHQVLQVFLEKIVRCISEISDQLKDLFQNQLGLCKSEEITVLHPPTPQSQSKLVDSSGLLVVTPQNQDDTKKQDDTSSKEGIPVEKDQNKQFTLRPQPLIQHIGSYHKFISYVLRQYRDIMTLSAKSISDHFTQMTFAINEDQLKYEFPSLQIHKSVIKRLILRDSRPFQALLAHLQNEFKLHEQVIRRTQPDFAKCMDLFWCVVCEDADCSQITDESYFMPPGVVQQPMEEQQPQDEYDQSDNNASPYASNAQTQIVIEKYVRDLRRQALQEYDDLLQQERNELLSHSQVQQHNQAANQDGVAQYSEQARQPQSKNAACQHGHLNQASNGQYIQQVHSGLLPAEQPGSSKQRKKRKRKKQTLNSMQAAQQPAPSANALQTQQQLNQWITQNTEDYEKITQLAASGAEFQQPSGGTVVIDAATSKKKRRKKKQKEQLAALQASQDAQNNGSYLAPQSTEDIISNDISSGGKSSKNKLTYDQLKNLDSEELCDYITGGGAVAKVEQANPTVNPTQNKRLSDKNLTNTNANSTTASQSRQSRRGLSQETSGGGMATSLNSDCRFLAGGSPQPRNEATPFQQQIVCGADSARAYQLKQLQLQSTVSSTQGSPLDRSNKAPGHPEAELEDLKSEEEEQELREFAAKLDRYWKEAPPVTHKIRPNISNAWLSKLRSRLRTFSRSKSRQGSQRRSNSRSKEALQQAQPKRTESLEKAATESATATKKAAKKNMTFVADRKLRKRKT